MKHSQTSPEIPYVLYSTVPQPGRDSEMIRFWKILLPRESFLLPFCISSNFPPTLLFPFHSLNLSFREYYIGGTMLNFHLFSISGQVFFSCNSPIFIIDYSVLRVLYSTFWPLAACVIYKYFLSVNKVSLCVFMCVSVDAHMPRCPKTVLGVDTGVQVHTWLYIDSGDSNSSLHMCAANALSTEQHH